MGEAMMFGFNLQAIASIGAAAVIATSAAYVKGRWDGHSAAVQSEQARVNNGNAESLGAADAGQQGAQSCTGTWNRSANKCE
jgi:hypothetical protein